MARDRLSPMDVAFLDVEDAANRAHLFGFLVFDGPAPSPTEFAAAIGRRLPQLPRFRQRIVRIPGGFHRPEWVDATAFRLEDHCGVVMAPAPGDRQALKFLADEMSSAGLDMDKPLWRLQLVTGLADGRFAIAMTLHHSMVDGISIMDVLSVLFSVEQDEPSSPARAWTPRPAPRAIRLLGRGLLDAARDLLRAMMSTVRYPRGAVQTIGYFRRTMGMLGQSPRTLFNTGSAGATRHNDWLDVPLAELKSIKTAHDTTINNVVLAVISGALRRYLLQQGESPEAMFAFVPVSVRPDANRGTLGNQIGLTFPRLPVDVADPAARLSEVASVAERGAQWQQANDTAALLALGGLTPPLLTRHLNRYIQLRSGLFNLTCTNVPGPPVPVYFCGRRMVQMLGSAPLTASHAVTIAVLSYNGTMFFSVTCDPDRVPEGGDLVGQIRAELDELLAVSGVSRERDASGA